MMAPESERAMEQLCIVCEKPSGRAVLCEECLKRRGSKVIAGVFCKHHGTSWDHRCHECAYMQSIGKDAKELLDVASDEESRDLIRKAVSEITMSEPTDPALGKK